jgi:Mn-dependent DtxR family transcriptional regulator
VPHTSAKPNPLPETQRSYLLLIREYIREHKVAPSYEAMAKIVGLSRNSPRAAVAKLIRRGLLTRGPGRFCNLVITPAGHRALRKK